MKHTGGTMAILVSCVLVGCGHVTPADPTAAAQPVGSGADGAAWPDAVAKVHCAAEWRRLTATLDEAREYYMVPRTFTDPADFREEARMEALLKRAADDVHRLLATGGICWAEAKLLALEIEEIPSIGNHHSRTVRLGTNQSAVAHYDLLSYPPAWLGDAELRKRMPALGVLAGMRGRNRLVVRAALAGAERHVNALEAEPAAEKDHLRNILIQAKGRVATIRRRAESGSR